MPDLEVVIPLYNEQAIVREYAQKLAHQLDSVIGAGRWQFIFVDNSSTDGTGSLVERLIEELGAGLMIHAPEPNYGLALRAGLNAARAPYVHTCDIEQWDIPFLAWAWAARGEHDLFIGSRRSDPTVSKPPPLRRFLSWGLNALIQLFFGYMGTDTHGPKLLNMGRLKPIIDVCVSDRGQFDTEIVLRATRAGLRIAEAPIAHEEYRPPRFVIFKKVGWNLVAFNRLRKILRDVPYGDTVHFHQFSRSDLMAVGASQTGTSREPRQSPSVCESP